MAFKAPLVTVGGRLVVNMKPAAYERIISINNAFDAAKKNQLIFNISDI